MRIIVVGATGTIGGEVVRAPLRKNHKVLPASRSSDFKVDLDDPAFNCVRIFRRTVRAASETVVILPSPLAGEGSDHLSTNSVG